MVQTLRMDGKESKETALFLKFLQRLPDSYFNRKLTISALSSPSLEPWASCSSAGSLHSLQALEDPLPSQGCWKIKWDIARKAPAWHRVATQKVLIPFPLTGLKRKSYLLCSQMILALGRVLQRNRTHRMHMSLLVWQSEDQQTQEPGRADVSLGVKRQRENHQRLSREPVMREVFHLSPERVNFWFYSSLQLIKQGPPMLEKAICFPQPINKFACMREFSHSVMSNLVTPWTLARQIPLSMEFSMEEYWSGLPFPSPGDLPNPGIEPPSPVFPALTGRFFITVPPGKSQSINLSV